jgi:hypothetical protein
MSLNEIRILNYGEPLYTENLYKKTYRMGVCFLELNQDSRYFDEICQSKNSTTNVFIWGDSHAAALYYGLKQIYPNINQFTAARCPPLKGTTISWRQHCKDVNDFVLKKIKEISPEKIILHADWSTCQELNLIEKINNTILLS